MRSRLIDPADKPFREHIHCFAGRPGGHLVPAHWHRGVEVVVVFAGTMRHQVGDDYWDLRTGDCQLIGGSAAHHSQAVGATRCTIWQLDPPTATRLAAALPPSLGMPSPQHDQLSPAWPPRRLNPDDLNCIRVIAQRAQRLCEERAGPTRAAALEGLAHAMLGLIANATPGRRTQRKVVPMADLITAIRQRPDADWTRDVCCERTGLNRNRFAREFRAAANASLPLFVRRLRIAMAQALLNEQRDLPLGEVATLCGFRSQAAFTTAFRSETGSPPRHWRRTHAAR